LYLKIDWFLYSFLFVKTAMNPSICINNVSLLYSDYSVICVLYRLIDCNAFDKVHVVKQVDKRGNEFQKMIVDFKQDVHTDAMNRFYQRIMDGNNRISSERRQHYWKVHFVPRPRIPVEKKVDPKVIAKVDTKVDPQIATIRKYLKSGCAAEV
jgi:hypothetical protein